MAGRIPALLPHEPRDHPAGRDALCSALSGLQPGLRQETAARAGRGASPEQVIQQRLALKPELVSPHFKPPDPNALPQALQVVAAAKEASQPDSH